MGTRPHGGGIGRRCGGVTVNLKRKFLYYSHQTLQVPRVARRCMVALCEGAAESGAEAEIVSFRARMHRDEPDHPPFAEMYDVSKPVRFTEYRLPGVKVDDDSFLFRIQRAVVYAHHFIRFALGAGRRGYSSIVISARNYSLLLILVLLKRMLLRSAFVVADVHGMPESRLARFVHRFVDGNVCISGPLADDLSRATVLPPGRLRAAHTGVKAERFRMDGKSREEVRRELDLPTDRRIICYTGKVYYRYEEVGYYLDTASLLGDEFVFLLVGGRPDQVALWEEETRVRGIRNVFFRSFAPSSTIPLYLRAADLLVAYYSPSPLNDYRSPGKLFEYLASGTPLISARFRAIEEVIRHGENGFLIDPYRPELLAEAIRRYLSDPLAAERVGARAVTDAPRFSWKKRADVFLSFAEVTGGGET